MGLGLVPGSGVSGRGQCRGGAFGRGGLRESDFLFITVSHCAWRHVISLSKATKKRSKENAFNHATLSVHSVQFSFMGAPKARCSPERRMSEPLLLANPDTNTLRPVRSRASTIAKEPARPHAFWLPRSSPERRMFEPLLLANPDTNTLRPVCSRASTSCQGTRAASGVLVAAFLRVSATWSDGYVRRSRHHACCCSSFGELPAWSPQLFAWVRPYASSRPRFQQGWRHGSRRVHIWWLVVRG